MYILYISLHHIYIYISLPSEIHHIKKTHSKKLVFLHPYPSEIHIKKTFKTPVLLQPYPSEIHIQKTFTKNLSSSHIPGCKYPYIPSEIHIKNIKKKPVLHPNILEVMICCTWAWAVCCGSSALCSWNWPSPPPSCAPGCSSAGWMCHGEAASRHRWWLVVGG